MEHRLFPYYPRKRQNDIMDAVHETISMHGHLAMESGTGTGKTVCVIAPALAYAIDNRKKVLYLTRTNSQQRQALLELRAISEKEKVFGVAIQGRSNLCPLFENDPELAGGTSEELATLCRERKKAVDLDENGSDGCIYYRNLKNIDIIEIEDWARDNLPTAEELSDFCNMQNICPYELNKMLIKGANLVAAPYIYFFNPHIRRALLEWLGVSLSDLIVVVDEAHNMPEYARELQSIGFSERSISMAIKEAERFGDIEIRKGTSITDLLRILEKAMSEVEKEYLKGDDGLIPGSAIEEEMMCGLRTTSHTIKNMLTELVRYGEIVKEKKLENRKLPRSYIHSVALTLRVWQSLEPEDYVKLVSKKDKVAIEAYALDASISTEPLLSTHASIHMSGTLEPLDEYRDSLGLPKDTRTMKFKSPFPPENRAMFYVDDVTTRYEDISKDNRFKERMAVHLEKLLAIDGKNTMVFFPSFSLLKEFRSILSLSKKCYFEEQGVDQRTLMESIGAFKKEKGAIFFAVYGGRISEGIDFPGSELELVVLVGIPYPKPTAKQKALTYYYDLKFNKGWEYTFKAPASRKMLQAIGRLIRNESDKGAVVILDKRVPSFQDSLPQTTLSVSPVEDVNAFFRTVPRFDTSK